LVATSRPQLNCSARLRSLLYDYQIIPLCDGPRNRAAKVWRIFESLDLINVGQVVTFYDGVGSSSFKPLALLGGAFSWRPSPTTSTLGKGKAVGMLERWKSRPKSLWALPI